ncbi:hypothetical protein Tco_0564799 [Tanacetum coccineum]
MLVITTVIGIIVYKACDIKGKRREGSHKDKMGFNTTWASRRFILLWVSQFDETKRLEEIDLNVVIRSNRQRRYVSTLIRVLSIFDREDINAIYQPVMDKYQDEIPEGFDRVLWGDLMIMFNPRVHTLMTKIGLVIHMLVEKKYPLRRKVLLQMLELKLESEEDSTMALELIRFVKKLIAELEPEDSDGNKEDL